MTAAAIDPEPVPLVRDQAGRLMVPGTRISLDILVAAFKRGESPEAIHDNYETVPLADVYAIFSYSLRHRAEVEEYLAHQEREGTEIQARIEAIYPPDGLRAKLLARLDKCTVRFVTDEHIARAMIAGLQRIDVVRVQDVGLRTLDDPAILQWAADEERVLITHDIKTMPDFAHQRVAAGQRMSPVFVVPMGMAIGAAIAELATVAAASDTEEWADRVIYLPLR